MVKWIWTAFAVVGGGLIGSACSGTAQAVTPQQLESQYGLPGAYVGQVNTGDASMRGTFVPVTLPDGRRAQLWIPEQRKNDLHPVYLRDDDGLHPVELAPDARRDQVAASPRLVARQEKPRQKKRSWEKEALIIGGGAGGGAAIGALAGGAKGAGVGAAVGGVGGLIYDLTTRNKH